MSCMHIPILLREKSMRDNQWISGITISSTIWTLGSKCRFRCSVAHSKTLLKFRQGRAVSSLGTVILKKGLHCHTIALNYNKLGCRYIDCVYICLPDVRGTHQAFSDRVDTVINMIVQFIGSETIKRARFGVDVIIWVKSFAQYVL